MIKILFSNHLLKIYAFMFCIYFISDTLLPFFIKNDKVNKIKQSNNSVVKSKLNKRDIIKSIVSLIISLILIFLYFTNQSNPFVIFIIMIIFLRWVILLPYAIWKTIRYIYGKPFNFIFTKDNETAFSLVGLSMFFICSFIAREETISMIGQKLVKHKPIIHDFIAMGLITIWYFIVLLFTISFGILSMHIINKIIISRFKVKPKKPKKPYIITSYSMEFSLADKLTITINKLPKEVNITKVLYNLIWLLCVIVDSMIMMLRIIVIDLIKETLLLIVRAFNYSIYSGIKNISNILSNNQGKAIIIITRISLVSSLVIVYLIDKYQQIFSPSGSNVYEFICSVIIIPLIIAQLLEIRKHQNIA